MRRRLAAILEEYGALHASLIRGEGTASPGTYAKRFGSLNDAIQMLYAETHGIIRQRVRQEIERVASHVQSYQDFLLVNKQFTVVV